MCLTYTEGVSLLLGNPQEYLVKITVLVTFTAVTYLPTVVINVTSLVSPAPQRVNTVVWSAVGTGHVNTLPLCVVVTVSV